MQQLRHWQAPQQAHDGCQAPVGVGHVLVRHDIQAGYRATTTEVFAAATKATAKCTLLLLSIGLLSWGIDGKVTSPVQLWSTETGLLRQTCRGHDGEVTDLAVSLDDSMVASSCTDWTIRCWSLKVL